MMSFHSTSFRYSVSVKAAGWGWHVLLPALVSSRFSTLSHPKAVHKRRMGVSTLSQWERVRGAGASDRDEREGALCTPSCWERLCHSEPCTRISGLEDHDLVLITFLKWMV